MPVCCSKCKTPLRLVTYTLYGVEVTDWQPDCDCDILAMEGECLESKTARSSSGQEKNG